MATKSLDLELSSGQYAYRADTASLSITGDISVEAWIKLEQLPGTAGTQFTIVAKWTNPSTSSYTFLIPVANKLSFYFERTDGEYSQFTLDAANAFVAGDVGVWHHVAVAVDVSVPSATFWIDGVEKSDTAVSTTATSIADRNDAFVIGARHGGTPDNFFDGLTKNVRVWNDIRTAQEISDNKCVELVGNEAGLAGSWNLDDNYLDQTANDNDLTASGSPVFSTDIPSCLAPAAGPSIVGWKSLLGVGQG